jgi:hypothetical protein
MTHWYNSYILGKDKLKELHRQAEIYRMIKKGREHEKTRSKTRSKTRKKWFF